MSIEIQNVDLPVLEGVVLQVKSLTGQMISTRADGLVILDDQRSFTIRVEHTEADIDYADMNRLMNEHVLAYPGAPIGNLTITRELDVKESEERIELKGTLRKLLHVPFEIEGIPAVTPDGLLRIRTTSIQAANLEVRGLLDLLGLESEDFLGKLDEHGLQFDGNDVILHLETLLPPPRLEGPVTSIALGEDHMHVTLGGAETRGPARKGAGHAQRNQLAFRHGTIRLGRVTMHDADLKIVDLDASDPFEFSFTKMNDQLVKGYAKLAPDGGLTAFAPDAGEVAVASPTLSP